MSKTFPPLLVFFFYLGDLWQILTLVLHISICSTSQNPFVYTMSKRPTNEKGSEDADDDEKSKKKRVSLNIDADLTTKKAVKRRSSTSSKVSTSSKTSKSSKRSNSFSKVTWDEEFESKANKISFFSSWICRNHFQTKVPTVLGPAIKMTIRMVTKMPKRRRIVVWPAKRRLDLPVSVFIIFSLTVCLTCFVKYF